MEKVREDSITVFENKIRYFFLSPLEQEDPNSKGNSFNALGIGYRKYVENFLKNAKDATTGNPLFQKGEINKLRGE